MLHELAQRVHVEALLEHLAQQRAVAGELVFLLVHVQQRPLERKRRALGLRALELRERALGRSREQRDEGEHVLEVGQ